MPAPSNIDEKVIGYLVEGNRRGILSLLEQGALRPAQLITCPPAGDKFALLPAAIERNWDDVSLRLIELGAEVTT